MKTIRHPKIVNPEVLSQISRSNLLALLSPFAAYLASRNTPLDAIADENSPIDDLVIVLSTPTESTPAELVERLELLDFIASPRCAANFEESNPLLVSSLRRDKDSTADLAVKILLQAPDVAYREFTCQAFKEDRPLVTFGVRGDMPFQAVTPKRIEDLQQLLSPWFGANGRSPFCSIHYSDQPGGVSFVIRHGDTIRMVPVLEEDGASASRLLRPERFDVAHYRRDSGEWRISGLGARLQELYRQAFGAVFHQSAEALIRTDRYSLEPLRDGPSSLACSPHGFVQSAVLKSIKLLTPDGNQFLISHGNVFAGSFHLARDLWQTADILEAKIGFKVAHRRSMVPVVLRPVNTRISGIHSEAIEQWLIDRQFARPVAARENFVLESA